MRELRTTTHLRVPRQKEAANRRDMRIRRFGRSLVPSVAAAGDAGATARSAMGRRVATRLTTSRARIRDVDRRGLANCRFSRDLR